MSVACQPNPCTVVILLHSVLELSHSKLKQLFKAGLCWFDNITLVMQRLRLPGSKLSCGVLSFKNLLVFFKGMFFLTMFRLSIVAKSKYDKVIHCLDLTLLTVTSSVYYFNLKLV